MKNTFILVALIATIFTYAQEENNPKKETINNNLCSSSRPDGHAPIGVMADHTHHKGVLMVSYRYMNMGMLRLKSGENNATNSDGFENYMVVPQNMNMNMHMIGVMYAPSNKITLMAMANYIQNDMDLQMMINGGMGMHMGMTRDFSTSSSGFADVSLSALHSIFNNNRKSLHASIPAGEIEAKDVTPMSMGEEVLLPYPMQLDSGSWGTKIGLTYLWQGDHSSFGSQINGQLFINDNYQDYKVGNRYQATTWVAAKASQWLSVSFRLKAQLIDKISGANKELNPMMVTTSDTQNSGGFYLHYGFGVNIMQPKGYLKGLLLGAEILQPLYQNVNGIQLDQSHSIILGLQYAFH